MEALFPQPLTLTQWLDLWVKGNLYQPALVQDPVTHEWRGATDEPTNGPLAVQIG